MSRTQWQRSEGLSTVTRLHTPWTTSPRFQTLHQQVVGVSTDIPCITWLERRDKNRQDVTNRKQDVAWHDKTWHDMTSRGVCVCVREDVRGRLAVRVVGWRGWLLPDVIASLRRTQYNYKYLYVYLEGKSNCSWGMSLFWVVVTSCTGKQCTCYLTGEEPLDRCVCVTLCEREKERNRDALLLQKLNTSAWHRERQKEEDLSVCLAITKSVCISDNTGGVRSYTCWGGEEETVSVVCLLCSVCLRGLPLTPSIYMLVCIVGGNHTDTHPSFISHTHTTQREHTMFPNIFII